MLYIKVMSISTQSLLHSIDNVQIGLNVKRKPIREHWHVAQLGDFIADTMELGSH